MALRLNLDKVHEFAIVNIPGGGTQQRLVRTSPYVRLKAGEGPPVFIQGGVLFFEGGDVVKPDQLPGWFDAQLRTLNKHTLAEVGWAGLPWEQQTSDETPPASTTSNDQSLDQSLDLLLESSTVLDTPAPETAPEPTAAQPATTLFPEG